MHETSKSSFELPRLSKSTLRPVLNSDFSAPQGSTRSSKTLTHSRDDTTDESGYDSVETDDYAPPQRSLQECVSTFYDQAQGVSNQLEPLKDTYDSILALSSRLLVLHPNSIETPTLALDLRNSLLHTASTLKVLDSNLFDLWESEERVRKACEKGEFAIDGLRGTALTIEVQRREDEVDRLARRFKRRCKDIKNQAREEREERRDMREEKREPFGVDDYLAGGLDCPDLTKKDVVHASRWVVTNPFTVLSKLLDNLRALQIPQMVATEQSPSTFLAKAANSGRARSVLLPKGSAETTPFMTDNPTPAGSSLRTRSISDWKAEILRKAPSKATPLHKVFDTISSKVDGRWYENKNRKRSEKWIIIGSMLLLPLILLAVLLEKLIDLSLSSSPSSSVFGSSAPATSYTSLFPTMMNTDHTGASEGASTSVARLTDFKRRETFDADSRFV